MRGVVLFTIVAGGFVGLLSQPVPETAFPQLSYVTTAPDGFRVAFTVWSYEAAFWSFQER